LINGYSKSPLKIKFLGVWKKRLINSIQPTQINAILSEDG
jgi:hypothetical protein